MGTQPDARHERQREAERQLLAVLCQHSLDKRAHQKIVQRLAVHPFLDPEHEILFLALTKLHSGNSEERRAALPSVLTRLGFPDYDLQPFFSMPLPSAQQIETLLQAI